MASKELPFSTVALYEYKSDFEDDLSFSSGQVIQVTSIEDEEWYTGNYTDSSGVKHTGMFPKNFVNEVDSASNLGTTTGPVVAQEEKVPEPASVTQSEKLPSIDRDATDTPDHPVIPKEQADAQKLEKSIAKENSLQEHEKPFSPKGLTSRISTFGSENSFPTPSAKPSESKSYNQSYKGSSSYIPPSLGSKTNDTKSKPDFTHSSYVPPPLKKDKPSASFEKSSDYPEPIKATTSFREEPQEDEGPKLSLKERIALIQKNQKEEAEREAEALKKKQQKKEAQKKAPLAPKADDQVESSALKGAEELEAADGETLASPIDNDESEDELTETLDSGDHSKGLSQEADEDEDADDGNAEVGDNDEEEEEEDSEEARRAALRDRMAKLAGAGMYGGFNPFAAAGGAPPSKATSSTKKKTKPVEEDNTPRAAPVPILPFGNVSNAPQIPDALKPKQTAREPEETEEENESEAEEKEPITSALETHVESAGTYDDHAQNKRASIADNESFLSASESVGGNKSLSERLTETDVVSPTKNINPESAVEGDDEYEKFSTSEQEDLTFSDREKERKEKTLSHISDHDINPTGAQNIASDYTTGYESDDDTQLPVQHEGSNNVLSTPSAPKVPPPPPSTAPQLPSGGSSKDTPLKLTREAPPIPGVPVPPASTEGHPESVPPPIPSGATTRDTEAVPPVPSRSRAPPPPPPTVPAPGASESEFTPSKPTRRSSVRSTRSFDNPPPIPQSPIELGHSPQLPNVPPPVPGIKAAATMHNPPLSPDSSIASPSVRRSSTLPVTEERALKGSVSSAASKGDLKLDIADGWWLRNNELPPSLQSRANKDLIFEVDENVVKRRGGKQLVLKDYYILNQDNSQIVLHVVFDPADPQSTVNITETTEAAPSPNKVELDEYSNTLGNKVFQVASKLVNQSLKEPLVLHILSQIPGVLKPVGLRSYGAVIYSNSNNTDVHQVDDFKPGDIIAINKAKFQGHNKLHQKVIYDVGNSGAPFAAVVTEFDESKRKFRVIETDASGKVKHSSYKPSDMKSGKIKVFRVVGREFVNWN